MRLKEQIIQKLIESGRNFYINKAYVGYGNMGQGGKLFYIDTSLQMSTENDTLMATVCDFYEPSSKISGLKKRYKHLDVQKTSFTSDREKIAEIKRLLKAGGFSDEDINKSWRIDEVDEYIQGIGSKNREDILLNGKAKIVTISLAEIYMIHIDSDDTLQLIWFKREDEDRTATEKLEFHPRDKDFFERFSLDNPVDFSAHIRNCIIREGRENFLENIVTNRNRRLEIIDEFLENGSEYTLLSSINSHVNHKLESALKKALTTEGLKYNNAFNQPYGKIKLVNNTESNIYPCLKLRTVNEPNPPTNINSWARAMMNTAIKVDIGSNRSSLYNKSKEEIVEALKPFAQKRYAKGKSCGGGIIGFRYYDLFQRHFDISFAEFGIQEKES